MRDDKKLQKIDDDTLENVSGGVIVARNLLMTDNDNTNPEVAVMSGDTSVNPLLLGGSGTAAGKGKGAGTAGNGNTTLLNTNGAQWA